MNPIFAASSDAATGFFDTLEELANMVSDSQGPIADIGLFGAAAVKTCCWQTPNLCSSRCRRRLSPRGRHTPTDGGSPQGAGLNEAGGAPGAIAAQLMLPILFSILPAIQHRSFGEEVILPLSTKLDSDQRTVAVGM